MPSTDPQIALGSEGSGGTGCDPGALWLGTWGGGKGWGPGRLRVCRKSDEVGLGKNTYNGCIDSTGLSLPSLGGKRPYALRMFVAY